METIRWTEKRKTQLIFVIDLAYHALCEGDDDGCEKEFRKDVLDFQTFMEKKGLYPTKED
jgi:hypothetical protein